jgi:hypothetical protein
VLSDDPVTRKFESEENSQSHTHLLCPVKVCSCLKEGTDQILTVWSDEQVASSLESGLQTKKEIRDSSTMKRVQKTHVTTHPKCVCVFARGPDFHLEQAPQKMSGCFTSDCCCLQRLQPLTAFAAV